MNQQPCQPKIGVVLHYSDDLPYSPEAFAATLNSIINQTDPPSEVLLLCQAEPSRTVFEIESVALRIVHGNFRNRSQWLNEALRRTESDYLIYLDNTDAEIVLKLSHIETMRLMLYKYPNLGMVYSDYEIMEQNQLREIRLLKHHAGRLRDNQDYGRVVLFSRAALRDSGGFDEHLQYRELYDIRLRLAEKYDILHVANKHNGSLYRVVAESKKHNVFDYLLAGKKIQTEAEEALTNHLKRTGAYLTPGQNLHCRPRSGRIYELRASVVIPVNRRPEFIATALGSVFAQTEKKIEVIVVVNGGHDDPTVAEVRRYLPDGDLYDSSNPPVQLVICDINNIGLSLNLGIMRARGEYYIQLDSDDRLRPDAIERVIQQFQSDDRIGIVIGSYEVWEKKEDGRFVRMKEIPVVTHDEWTEDNGRNNLLHINGAGAPRCIPIDIIREMGYFGINDEPYARNYGEDYDLVLKISEKYRVGRIYEPIYEVIRHSGGTDHSIDQVTIDRNDEAKDAMRKMTLERRIRLNQSTD